MAHTTLVKNCHLGHPRTAAIPTKIHGPPSHKFKLRHAVSSSPLRGLFHISLCISCKERDTFSTRGHFLPAPQGCLPFHVQPSARRKRGSTTSWRSPRALASVPGERAVWLLKIWQRPSPMPEGNRGTFRNLPKHASCRQTPATFWTRMQVPGPFGRWKDPERHRKRELQPQNLRSLPLVRREPAPPRGWQSWCPHS